MAKRKVESQTGNLTPDHGKSRIDLIPLRAGGVEHTVGKLSTRAITSIQKSSQSEVFTRSYEPAKLQESQLSNLQESRDKKPFGCHPRGEVQSILYGGKVVASPESRLR
jgi:hypothetical protein